MGESEELLDVLDDAGEPIGQKSRAQIHRDHDRHGLVFVWSAWESEGRQYLLLQRRGSAGDPFFGRADALAGGHIGAEHHDPLASPELIADLWPAPSEPTSPSSCFTTFIFSFQPTL